jgi:hypothetical protein
LKRIAAETFMAFQKDGGCQCGAVRYRVSEEPVRVAICHCTQCQRQSGSAFSMAMIVRDAAFALLQGQLKLWTRSSDAERPVICGFCAECGTRVTHRAELYRGFTNVRPGTLDDRSWLRPTMSVWMSEKQPWVQVPDDLVLHETQPQPR